MKDPQSIGPFEKIRVPGADDPKNALEVFKNQLENFSKFNRFIFSF